MEYDGIIDATVEDYEARTGITLDVHGRETLREMIERENKYEARREAFEEKGHSHSVIGER